MKRIIGDKDDYFKFFKKYLLQNKEVNFFLFLILTQYLLALGVIKIKGREN